MITVGIHRQYMYKFLIPTPVFKDFGKLPIVLLCRSVKPRACESKRIVSPKGTTGRDIHASDSNLQKLVL